MGIIIITISKKVKFFNLRMIKILIENPKKITMSFKKKSMIY